MINVVQCRCTDSLCHVSRYRIYPEGNLLERFAVYLLWGFEARLQEDSDTVLNAVTFCLVSTILHSWMHCYENTDAQLTLTYVRISDEDEKDGRDFFFFFSHPFLASSRCTRQKRETSCGPIWREFTYFKNVKPILVHNDESQNMFNFTNLFVCVVYSGECLRHTNEKRKTSCSFWRACTRPSKRNLFFFSLSFFKFPFHSF